MCIVDPRAGLYLWGDEIVAINWEEAFFSNYFYTETNIVQWMTQYLKIFFLAKGKCQGPDQYHSQLSLWFFTQKVQKLRYQMGLFGHPYGRWLATNWVASGHPYGCSTTFYYY